ncbi:MAG TPA: TolC family protein, partial [Lysobacter sp.]|nr:TolC family protein [Lysobacter sp.]
MRKSIVRTAALSALSLALSACMLGPDHVRPDVPTAERFARAEATATAAAPADLEFWRGFDDPVLIALVEDALRANHDLRIALAQLDRADALARGTRFDRLPTITAGGEAADVRASADQAPAASRAQRDGERYSASAVFGWELDLFGRVRRGIEAGDAEAAAGASDLEAMQVAVVGEVARIYVELRGLQERLRVARANADNQAETLRLVQARLDAGRGTEFDSARARAQLAATRARIPALEAQAATAMHRLAVLTGRTPDALITTLEAARPLPAPPPA